MSDYFSSFAKGVNSPAIGAVAVQPSDTLDLETPIRAITLGQAGKLSFIGTDGQGYQTGILPVGTYSVFIRRVRVAGTTATDLTGWI